MTDKEYRETKRRLVRLAERWLKPLGLLWWDIDLVYSREPIDAGEANRKENWNCRAQCRAKWQYLKATLTFNMPALCDDTDAELEDVFVHECLHALVNEMRGEEGCTDHEERVVTQLANAFLWTRKEVLKEAAKPKRRAKR